MTIDADLLAYYRARSAEAFPPLPADADALAVRRQFPRCGASVCAAASGRTSIVTEITVPLNGRELRRADLSASGSESERTALPLLVYLHGGGWVVGDLDTHDRSSRALPSMRIARSRASITGWRRSIRFRRRATTRSMRCCGSPSIGRGWVSRRPARRRPAIARARISRPSPRAAANDRVAGLVTRATAALSGDALALRKRRAVSANADGPGLTDDEMKWYWSAIPVRQPNPQPTTSARFRSPSRTSGRRRPR